MKEEREKIRQGAEVADKVLDDYKQRISQVIEEEGNRIRKETEQESADIIARARKEAARIVIDARIVGQLRAEQIIGDVRKEAEQGAARYMAQSKQKVEQIAGEFIEEASVSISKDTKGFPDSIQRPGQSYHAVIRELVMYWEKNQERVKLSL